jgi:Amt family ammonium transporter
VFASKALNGVADGVLFGNPWQIVVQATAVLATMAYSGIMSFALLKAIGAVTALRATAVDESVGLDVSQHGEEAYVHAEGSSTLLVEAGERPIAALDRTPSAQSVPA